MKRYCFAKSSLINDDGEELNKYGLFEYTHSFKNAMDNLSEIGFKLKSLYIKKLEINEENVYFWEENSDDGK